MIRALLFAVTACFVFGPRLRVLDLHIVVSMALALLGLQWALVDALRLPSVRTAVKFQVPVLIYALLLVVVFGSADLTVPWIIVKGLIYLFAAYAVTVLYVTTPGIDAERDLFRDIFWAGVLNGGFVIMVVLIPELRSAADSVLLLDGKEQWIATGFRGFDLSMGGGASASIVFAALFFAGLSQGAVLGRFWIVACALGCLFLAVFLTGRTGLAFILAGTALMVLLSLFRGDGAVPRRALQFVAVLAALVIAMAGYISLSSHPAAVQAREVVIPWALEGVIGSGTSSGGNESLNRIMDSMYFLPPSDGEVLFGTSNAGRSDRLPYVASDVGYIRLIFSVGLVGLFLLAVSFWPMLATAASTRGGIWFLPLGFLLGSMAVANFKELFLAPRGGGAILALWFIGALLHAHRSRVDKVVFRAALPRGGADGLVGLK